MNLALIVKVLDAEQQFATNNSNVRFAEVGGFQLFPVSS